MYRADPLGQLTIKSKLQSQFLKYTALHIRSYFFKFLIPMLRIFLLLNYPSQNQLFMVKYVWAAAIMGLSVSE